jgi:DNA-binding transcriptional ArsR family regulator
VVKYIDETLEALADPSRRGAVDLLMTGPKRAGELAQALGLSGPAASRHLRTLRRCGLVEVNLDRDDSRARLYSLRPERFEDLSAWLEEVRMFWTEQLESFKDYAEARAPMKDSLKAGRGKARRSPKTSSKREKTTEKKEGGHEDDGGQRRHRRKG